MNLQHIIVLENAESIDSDAFRQLYLDKLEHLKKKLLFFERNEISATVTFHAQYQNFRLNTTVSVDCDDDVFRALIEQATLGFNSIYKPV